MPKTRTSAWGAALTLSVCVGADADVTGITVERHVGADWIANGYDPTALDTWRVYVTLSDDTDQVVAVYGDPANPLMLSSADGAFANEGAYASDTAPIDLTSVSYWDNQWDTYVTIDATDATGDAIGLTPGFASQTGNLASSFVSTYVAWYVTPEDLPQGEADGGRVLVAQLTVAQDAAVFGRFNVQLAGGETATLQFNTESTLLGTNVLLLDNFADNDAAHTAVSALELAGLTIGLGPSSVNVDADSVAGFDAVIIGGGEWQGTSIVPPPSAQSVLVDFVADGGGLIVGGTLLDDLAVSDALDDIVPIDDVAGTFTDAAATPYTVDTVGSDAIVLDGVASTFTMLSSANDTDENFIASLVTSSDARVFATATRPAAPGKAHDLVTGRRHALGRVIGVANIIDGVALGEDEFAQLIANAARWAALGKSGDGDGDRLGASLAVLGDVDGDDIDDYVVGAPMANPNGSDSGTATVRSGATGGVIHAVYGDDEDDQFGLTVASVGDVDGDATPDFAVGAPVDDDAGVDAGLVRIFSGADGTLIDEHVGRNAGDRFGHAISGGDDYDDDGTPDYLIGAPRFDGAGSNRGRVYVYSGATGNVLKNLTGENDGDQFGFAVASLGPIDGDPYDDFIVGAPKNDDGGNKAGKVYAYGGGSYPVLFSVVGENNGDRLGHAVARVGYADDDGFVDFAMSAPYFDKGNKTSAGIIYVWSGVDETELWRSKGQAQGDRMGEQLAGGRDVDGDGSDDVIASSARADNNGDDSGRVYVRNGETGGTIARFDGNAAGDRLGDAVALLDDVDGNGTGEALVGAPSRDGLLADSGGIYVVDVTDEESAFACSADLTGDGRVDTDDMLIVVAAIEAAEAPGPDIDGDGDTDPLDLVALLDAWGACP